MIDKKKLIQFCARFWNVEEARINEDFKFDNINLKNLTSIRMYQFLASVESNFKVKVVNINNVLTFKDLLENLK